ncbi:MAG: ABC transporter ATP-binding protein [Parasporobacterium sp.]|nr:ABC transporter ATP-binding protein [Parasporobacterium sp.]
MGIKVEEVIKTYPCRKSACMDTQTKQCSRKLTAVDNVSFEVYKGEALGLLGANGAGKTTMLRMLAGIVSPDRGKIIINGKNIYENRGYARTVAGFLTNEMKLEDCFTPEYLFDFFSDLYGVDRSVREERKDRLFAAFGLWNESGRKISHMSTGMKQKTSIVISLVHDPPVIIFDEPTNGLDIMTSRSVEDYLLEQKKAGKTLILSTHIFSLAEKVCDRIGIMRSGRMVTIDAIEGIKRGRTLEESFFELLR